MGGELEVGGRKGNGRKSWKGRRGRGKNSSSGIDNNGVRCSIITGDVRQRKRKQTKGQRRRGRRTRIQSGIQMERRIGGERPTYRDREITKADRETEA